MKLFLQKNAKFSSAGGSDPQNSPPPLRISGYAPAGITLCYKTFALREVLVKVVIRTQSQVN